MRGGRGTGCGVRSPHGADGRARLPSARLGSAGRHQRKRGSSCIVSTCAAEDFAGTRARGSRRGAAARCGSASAGRSGPARRRWSPRCAGPSPPTVALAVVTNDIYTTEDADFLLRHGVLPAERVRAVETGCCPHTAIRDDIAANLDAIEDLEAHLPPLDLVLVESGGDNLTATFSRALVDRQIFVLDVAGGDKVPRKGGPGVTSADLLVINKTDLAPLVGADLAVMARDAAARAGRRRDGVLLAGRGPVGVRRRRLGPRTARRPAPA